MSSLNDKKNALFSKNSSSVSTPTSNLLTNSKSTPVLNPSLTNKKITLQYDSGGISSTILTPAQKQKKLDEAKVHLAKGNKYLETSLFQWTPDYLGAAPCFEKASNCYKAINENEQAIDLLVKAAEYHVQANCLGTAAGNYINASTIAKSLNKAELSGKYLEEAATLFGSSGDLNKYAEYMSKAATEIENVNDKRATTLYEKALDKFFPSSNSTDTLKNVHIKAVDTIREYFSFLVRKKKYANAIFLAENKMIPLYQAMEFEQSLFKLLAGICILLLAMDDIVQSDQKFVQEHFSIKGYISSKECEVTEMFIMAFKQGDDEMLAKAQASQLLSFLEMDIQAIAKSLKINSMEDIESNENQKYTNAVKIVQKIETNTKSADLNFANKSDNNDAAVAATKNNLFKGSKLGTVEASVPPMVPSNIVINSSNSNMSNIALNADASKNRGTIEEDDDVFDDSELMKYYNQLSVNNNNDQMRGVDTSTEVDLNIVDEMDQLYNIDNKTDVSKVNVNSDTASSNVNKNSFTSNEYNPFIDNDVDIS